MAGSGAAAAPVAGGGRARPPSTSDGQKLGAEGRDWIRNLDPSTPTVRIPNNPKNPTHKSFACFEDHKGATTIAEYRALHKGPDSSQRNKDLLWDVGHGFILISTAALLNALEGSGVAPLLAAVVGSAPANDGATAPPQDGASDAPPGLLYWLRARNLPAHVALHDFLAHMCAAAETSVDAVLESEARIAGVSPEMYRFRQLEGLEP